MLWMDEIHFAPPKKPREAFAGWYFQANHHYGVSLAVQDFVHPQCQPGLCWPWLLRMQTRHSACQPVLMELAHVESIAPLPRTRQPTVVSKAGVLSQNDCWSLSLSLSLCFLPLSLKLPMHTLLTQAMLDKQDVPTPYSSADCPFARHPTRTTDQPTLHKQGNHQQNKRNKRTIGQTDRRTDRQAGRQTSKQTSKTKQLANRHTTRQADRQTTKQIQQTEQTKNTKNKPNNKPAS